MGSANGLTNGRGGHPLFAFGVITDVQYADIPNGHSFLGVPRFYRHSMLVLQRAVKSWNNNKNLNFAIHFGDIVDGKCPKDQSLNAVKKVVDEFENFKGPVYHMIGNHCLYNLPRDKLLPLLKIPNLDGGRAYYEFSPAPGYRFVVLDGYDISAIGWPHDHPKTLEALKFLRERNPNSDKNSPNGLEGLDRRFLMFNGAVGEEQMEWLDCVLRDAINMKQKVVDTIMKEDIRLILTGFIIECSKLPWNARQDMIFMTEGIQSILTEFIIQCLKLPWNTLQVPSCWNRWNEKHQH
ncbi:hypothetical protein E1A91_D03G116200v1 [Gossypium mustelinum]|uniref:Calcineurin-like phosphoesterase domain-containing protein n=1 Tax=Gossypium mustelinum TaxID=34275 RepID=A0A5D2VLZ2_GOSMU|nr:hypothetical protein E1A91_D03G116200v1 [Gossypium mustelinum]